MTAGWYGMSCWNALGADQKHMLIKEGVLKMGRKRPEGRECSNGAEVCIETMYDEAPGPRFYCRQCAAKHLAELAERTDLTTRPGVNYEVT
jgi:hypothetical protein